MQYDLPEIDAPAKEPMRRGTTDTRADLVTSIVESVSLSVPCPVYSATRPPKVQIFNM